MPVDVLACALNNIQVGICIRCALCALSPLYDGSISLDITAYYDNKVASPVVEKSR